MAEEKPILFSGEMVRAILNGRKTQTRRVIPHAGRGYLGYIQERNTHWFGLDLRTVGNGPETSIEVSCPYGRPGDLLWVRETWSGSTETGYIYKPSEKHRIWYRADNNRPTWADGRWRPSIFMPRWASRITLRVTDVRVERVQDISEADAQREGWFFQNHNLSKRYDPVTMDTARQWFTKLWDEINGNRRNKQGDKLPYAWKDNPWVWVVEFERLN